MKIILVWSKTSDTLHFDVINDDLAYWFVDTSQRLGNCYSPGDEMIDVIKRQTPSEILIQQEIEFITKVNDQLRKLRMPEIDLPTNWYDQRQLNRLHKDWAQTRLRWPKLTELFYKLDKDLYHAYQEMNCHIHLIEKSFEHAFRDRSNWREPNPFKDSFYDWHVCHLYLKYPGHGRHAFEKFSVLDIYEDMGRDDVNWHNVDAYVGINFVRPYQLDPPREFLYWCKQNNLVPHGTTIPLGNLVDWQSNLSKARQIITENVKITDNFFSLAIQV